MSRGWKVLLLFPAGTRLLNGFDGHYNVVDISQYSEWFSKTHVVNIIHEIILLSEKLFWSC